MRQVKLRVAAEEVSPAGAEGRGKGGRAAASPLVCLPPRELVQSLNIIGLRVDEALPWWIASSIRRCCTARNAWTSSTCLPER